MTAGRRVGKLGVLRVGKLTKPGLYGDGAGLWLQVGPTGGKAWLFRYMLRGKARAMGLGPVHTVSLAEAREAARQARKLLLDGIDPLDAREARNAAQRLEKASGVTFKEATKQYIDANRSGWRNEKHADQWFNTLDQYAHPTFGDLPVSAIDTALVVKALEKIWHEKPETASRVRGRVESILDWATVRTYRKGENPARWRGHLEHLLPTPLDVKKSMGGQKHYSALPYDQAGEFMEQLRKQPGIGAQALEFAILTTARTGEVVGATWSEIDLAAKRWTVPKARMKAHKEHRAALSSRAVEILDEMKKLAGGNPKPTDFVFPGASKNGALSSMALLMVLRRMERADVTTHGFRSTFRDWCAEETTYPSEVAEMALAHTVSDKVEAAYRRGDLLKRRYKLAEDWARYCAKPAKSGESKVVPIRGKGA